MTARDRLTEFQAELSRFTEERDWRQFHDPKSLILALVGEVGELAELFQWIPADAARDEFSDGRRKERAAEEISDVFIYLLALADVLGVDLLDAAHRKLEASRHRFAVADVRGAAPDKD